VELEFEWDEEKARTNLAKHRVSFLTAAEIFANEIMERIDDREDYGEVRWIALGRADRGLSSNGTENLHKELADGLSNKPRFDGKL
jgi:uncharacterized DUF497 family protein